jgi:hypothetical protein
MTTPAPPPGYYPPGPQPPPPPQPGWQGPPPGICALLRHGARLPNSAASGIRHSAWAEERLVAHVGRRIAITLSLNASSLFYDISNLGGSVTECQQRRRRQVAVRCPACRFVPMRRGRRPGQLEWGTGLGMSPACRAGLARRGPVIRPRARRRRRRPLRRSS